MAGAILLLLEVPDVVPEKNTELKMVKTPKHELGRSGHMKVGKPGLGSWRMEKLILLLIMKKAHEFLIFF